MITACLILVTMVNGNPAYVDRHRIVSMEQISYATYVYLEGSDHYVEVREKAEYVASIGKCAK